MPNQLLLDRYRILDQAGSGGFATVYAAWDTSLQRKVAIKQIEISELDAYRATTIQSPTSADPEDIPPWEENPAVGLDQLDYPADPDFLGGAPASGPDQPLDVKLGDVEQQRFFSHIPGLDEARAAAHLEDPNIVHVHDFQITGTHAYIIMEYLDGITLTEFLADYDDELTLDIIAAVFSDVAHALEIAHENQVMHFDIKPDNIIITRKGVVKVTDFGMAALSDLEGNAHTHGGTIGYMPLEQMRQETLDARCDEWALASVTYQMISGENPFLAPNLAQAEKAIESAELILPSLMWDELDNEANDVLFYALDPNRDERYDNVTDFAEEFSPFLGDPRAGRKALAALLSHGPHESEEEKADGLLPRVPWRERIDARSVTIAGRIWAALSTAGLAALGCANIPWFSDFGAIAIAIAALIGILVGAFRPSWGALMGGLCWGVALLANQLWALGVIAILATTLWWSFCGKDGQAASQTALSQPWTTVLGIPVLGPLLAGYFLTPVRAAATAGYAVVVSFTFGSVGRGNLYTADPSALLYFSKAVISPNDFAWSLFTTPSTWVIALSWIAAAWVLALFCTRGRRNWELIGAAVATALLILGLLGASVLVSGETTALPSAIQTFLVLICGCVIAALSWNYFPLFDPPADTDEPPSAS